MKKVLAIACLVLIFVAATVITASAAENNWRFYIYTDDGAGSNGSNMQVGVSPTSKDPLPSDIAPLSDGQDNRWTCTGATLKTIGGIFDNKAWNKDIKSPLMPWNSAYQDDSYLPFKHKKVWSLRIAGAGSANTNTPIRLQFKTVSGLLPPKTLTVSAGPPAVTVPDRLWLKMVNNRDKEGAPANGKVWSIPIPTVHSANSFFTLTLPTFNMSVAQSESALISEGYVMEFYQTPEPSSLLALGAGLMGLAGFASKRRRG